jgi:hypothetical protein
MTRHYRTAMLLIEFEGDRAFALQPPSELGPEIDPRNVVSRLCLLLLHFPRLRLMWSRSLHATADLFLALKSNQDEPDAAAAALVGVPVGPDGQPVPVGGARARCCRSASRLRLPPQPPWLPPCPLPPAPALVPAHTRPTHAPPPTRRAARGR